MGDRLDASLVKAIALDGAIGLYFNLGARAAFLEKGKGINP